MEAIQKSIYVDNLVSGRENVEETFKLCETSKTRLAEANLNLQKISTTRRKEAQKRIYQPNRPGMANNFTNGADNNEC